MKPLPQDWREQLVQMIVAGPEPDPERAAAWFRGGTGLTAQQQIGVYREQYQLRLGAAVTSAYPALSHLVGDEISELVAAFLADVPSHTWTLDHVGDRLADWLAGQGATRARVDAARMDYAVHHAFSAAEGTAPDPATLGPNTRLTHAPSLSVLHLGGAWHRYRSQVKAGESPSPPEPADVHLAVYRFGHDVRHRVLHPLEARLLAAFASGSTLVQVVEAIVAAGADLPTLQTSLQDWFRQFAERTLLVVHPDE